MFFNIYGISKCLAVIQMRAAFAIININNVTLKERRS